jgi:hypothetical protein
MLEKAPSVASGPDIIGESLLVVAVQVRKWLRCLLWVSITIISRRSLHTLGTACPKCFLTK